MIIDSNLVFIDDAITASGESKAIALTSFTLPGRMGPIPMVIKATEDFNNLTSLTFTMQTSDTQDGTYTDLPGGSLSIPASELVVGTAMGWGYLPRNVELPWMKLKYTVDGTAPTQGHLFAALTREEDQPYVAQLYIDKGVVKAVGKQKSFAGASVESNEDGVDAEKLPKI